MKAKDEGRRTKYGVWKTKDEARTTRRTEDDGRRIDDGERRMEDGGPSSGDGERGTEVRGLTAFIHRNPRCWKQRADPSLKYVFYYLLPLSEYCVAWQRISIWKCKEHSLFVE